jgi:hypothetical protein
MMAATHSRIPVGDGILLNDYHQQFSAAATHLGMVTELNGWL